MEKKTYIGNKYYNLPLLLGPILLLPALLERQITTQVLLGYFLFSGVCIAVALLPLAFKLEVSSTNIKTYFFGFCIRAIDVTKVTQLYYSNLFRGGLGAGKALKGWETLPDGSSKYFSIGEKAYSKAAIQHAMKVLNKYVSVDGK